MDEKSTYKIYQKLRVTNWNRVADKYDNKQGFSSYYHNVWRKCCVLLFHQGSGSLRLVAVRGICLAALKPSYGVGIDFSPQMITRARERHPELHLSKQMHMSWT